MTRLVRPDTRLAGSWAEAVAEFGEETMHGSGLWDVDLSDTSPARCEELVATLRASADPATPRPDGHVPCTFYWITDGAADASAEAPEEDEQFVGYLALRHHLTPRLLEEGGHIGYSVRPSRRRQGHAARALAEALQHAADLGLERVLLTCDEDNPGSARTIERNGGVLEDVRAGYRRYWITLR